MFWWQPTPSSGKTIQRAKNTTFFRLSILPYTQIYFVAPSTQSLFMSHFYICTAKVICSVRSLGTFRWCIQLCLQMLSLHPRGPLYQLLQSYAPPIRTPVPDSTADLTDQYVGSVTSTVSVLKGPLNKLLVHGNIGSLKVTVFLVCGTVCPDDSGGWHQNMLEC